ncbi:MAG: hypothetical protein ACRCR2_05130 [Fusobacteriaceae bacterium]
MRKQQLENLKIGDKVQAYNKEEIAVVKFIPAEEGQKFILTVYGAEKSVAVNTLVKNYKLIEEEATPEIATTVEPIEIELTTKEKEFLYHMVHNYYSDILESGGEFTFAVIEQLSYSEKSARGVISSLIKKGMVVVTDYKGEEPVISFTDQGHIYTEQNLDNLKRVKELVSQTKDIADNTDIEPTIPTAVEVVKGEPLMITVTQMAEALGMKAQDARRILRKANIEKPEQGWKVEVGSAKSAEILAALQGTLEKREMKRVKA